MLGVRVVLGVHLLAPLTDTDEGGGDVGCDVHLCLEGRHTLVGTFQTALSWDNSNTALPLPLALSKPAFAWGELWNEPPVRHLWAALLPEKRQKGFNKEGGLGTPSPCSQKLGCTHYRGNYNTNICTTNVNKSVKRWEVVGFVRSSVAERRICMKSFIG